MDISPFKKYLKILWHFLITKAIKMPRSLNSVTHYKCIKYMNRAVISIVWISAIQEANFGLMCHYGG